MNDPHVEELVYHIETGEGLNFQDPPPIEDETDAFRMTLEDGVATFSMKEHYATEKEARQAVEGYLRAWELDVALEYDGSKLRFVFDRWKIVDRDPPPPPPPGTPRNIQVRITDSLGLSDSVTPVLTQGQYLRPRPAAADGLLMLDSVGAPGADSSGEGQCQDEGGEHVPRGLRGPRYARPAHDYAGR